MAENTFKITPDFVIGLILRRRWIILVPFFLAILIGIYVAITLPKIYESKTLIFVDPQSVPQNYVQAIVTEDVSSRINTISQEILSRSNLEKIIQDFGLFRGPEQKNLFMEDKVSILRKSIKVDVTSLDRRRGSGAFSVSFKGKDPETVARLANGLASYFINENLKVRESQAIGTSDFLDSQLEDMRKRLEQVEETIKEYRKSYMGELPEQLETNLRILDRLQDNLTDRQNALRDARLRLVELESQATSRPQSVVVIGSDQGRNEGAASLDDMRAELEALQSKYTDKHPDIIRLKKMIAEAEAKAQRDSAGQRTPESLQASRVPAQIRSQIIDARREIELTETEIQNIKSQIDEYSKRIEATPKREQELLSLRRDYQNIQSAYDSLLGRKLEADIAVNMERKQKGEQFRVIDPARVPQRPSEPDMRKLFLFVSAAGLGLGGGIAFLLEFLRPSFRKPDEVETAFDLPVIATIPTIQNPRQILWHTVNFAASIFFSFITLGVFAVFAFICITGGDMVVNAIKRVI